MKKDNKGFSLVELIIVIAIMAVLIGILAPQYLKYVNRSRISTDLTNAEEIATAVSAAIADGTITAPAAGGTNATGNNDWIIANTAITRLEASKVDNSLTAWVVEYNADGIVSITLGGKDIYPTPDAIWTLP